MKTAEIHSRLDSFCAESRTRIIWERNRATIYPREGEPAAQLLRTVQDSFTITAGNEGHEYLRELGLIQHVYALRIGAIRLRIVSPAYPPRGLFSNLRALERRIAA